jgi:hypothetical protein
MAVFRYGCVRRNTWGIDPGYDTIGVGYTAVRREDPRIAARIRTARATFGRC